MTKVGLRVKSLAGGAIVAASMCGALAFGVAPASAYGPTPSPSDGSSQGATSNVPDGTPAAASNSSSNLAFTGTDAVITTVVGAGAVGVGGVLVLASRRRRQAQPA